MAQPDDFCPYKGLLPYTDEDRDYFFGREEEQETIGANLATSALTIFYGASGVGKSSVLMAGVVPFLRTVPNVTVVVFRAWQDRTFLSLLKAEVARVVAERAGRRCSTDQPLDELLAQAARTTRGILAIILDQFEEYFLNHPIEEIGNDFEAELARAINRDDIDANFLLSIREDGLSLLDRFQGRIPNLLSNLLRLEHLDGDAAIRAIRKPLDQYNQLRAAPGVHITIENALVNALVDELRTGRVTIGQVGQGQLREDGSAQGITATDRIRIETPFLQMVLTRLWTEEMAKNSCALQLSTFDRLGRAQQIVRTHLDDVMKKLDATEQEVCALFFDRLVTPSGNKIAYTVDDLREWAGDLDQFVPSVLKTLSDNRILRGVAAPPGQPAALRYEIFHDVLAPAILGWKARFQQAQELAKVEQQRAAEAARQQEELAQARALAEEQKRRAEDQQRVAEESTRAARRIQRLSLALVVASLLVMGVVGIVVVVWIKHKNTQVQAQQARVQGQQASSREAAIIAINYLGSNPELSVLWALRAASEAYTPEAEDALHQAVQAPRARRTLQGHTDTVRGVAFSPDRKALATASADGTVRVWEVTSGQLMRPLVGHTGPVSGVAFSPDGAQLATASQDRTARVWEVASGREVQTLVGHKNIVNGVAFSADGKRLATASADGTARVWEVASGREVQTLAGHAGAVVGIAFSLDGKTLATASEDKMVKVWDVDPGYTGSVIGIASRPNETYVVTGSQEGPVEVWDATSGQVVRLLGHTGPVSKIAFNPDGLHLATASRDKTARVWEMASGREVRVLAGHKGPVIGIAFSPDGTHLATGSEDGTVIVWEVASGREVRTLPGHKGPVIGIAFSPDGRELATASTDGTVIVWEVASGQVVRPLVSHTAPVSGIAYSPNEKWLITGSQDGTVIVWEVASGREVRTLPGHKGPVIGIAFSPDGRELATASTDGRVKVWKATADWEVRTLPGHTSAVTGMAFSPVGKHLATASSDKKMVVYPLEIGDLMNLAWTSVPRQLTSDECLKHLPKYSCQLTPSQQ